jgi:hypothetical protein
MIKFPYNRIISYGCSFTAGSELTDGEFFPMSEEDLFKYVKKHNITGSEQLFRNLKLSPTTVKNIFARNATKSWPNYIANKFDKSLHNRAVPGSSLSLTTYRILKDLHDSAIDSDDFVLVGVTSPARWFQFFEDGNSGGGVVGMGWKGGFSEEYIKNLELHWFNAYNIVYNHFKEMAFLSNLSDRLNGQIKLSYAFGAPAYLKHFFKEELKDKKFSEFYDFCVSMCPQHNFIGSQYSISELASYRDDSKHHVFGHPRVQFHEHFANILIKDLEEMYSD